MSVRRPERLERLLSYTWVHSTILVVHFTPLENSMTANTWGKTHTNYPPVMKSELSIRSPIDRGALVPEYLISDKSFISESVKGQVQVLNSTSRPVKQNVKTTKVCA